MFPIFVFIEIGHMGPFVEIVVLKLECRYCRVEIGMSKSEC